MSKREYAHGRKKGQSLLSFPKDFTVIDLETTGLDPEWDEIIEVAMIRYRNGEEVDKFSSLVMPEEGPYISSFITELTGITPKMLKDAPKIEEIKDPIWNFLQGEIILGHNTNFDLNFLYDLFIRDERILGNDFIDTRRISRWVLPELKHHRLSDICAFFGINQEYHRAEEDCMATVFAFKELEREAAERNTDFTPKRSWKAIDLKALVGNPEEIDETHILYGKRCVFTGKLERLTRAEAGQLVVNIGGLCDNNITKKTDFLIFGNYDYLANIKDGKSNKLKKAEELISKGQDLTIISESAFYDMLLED